MTTTTPQKPIRTRHPLVNIAEWRKGCSCAPVGFPVKCEQCTEGLIAAVETWFLQNRSTRITGIASVLESLDANGGLPATIEAKAAAIIRSLEAELYAADDQVTGLQELMANQAMPAHLDHAVRLLVDTANADGDTTGVGSPAHGHNIRGRWDGDSQHPKGSLCEECAAWDALRLYTSKDITAVETFSREVELHAALVKAQKVIDMLFPGVSMIFGVDFQELNESCAAVSAALKPKMVAVAPVDVYAATAAKILAPEIHAVPVDLVVDLLNAPAGVSNVPDAVTAIGIKWELCSVDHTGCREVKLSGCTGVPLVLPNWIKVKK